MLDLLLRGGAIGTILLTSAILLGHQRSRSNAVPVAVFGCLISCYLILSSVTKGDFGWVIHQILIVGATLVPLAFTWMLLALLTGPQTLRWPWLALAATSAISLVAPVWLGAAQVRNGLMVALFLGLMVLVIRSDQDDLVDARRRFRRVFLAVMTLLGIVISTIEVTGADQNIPLFVSQMQAATFWALAVLFAWQTLRPGGDLLPVTQETPKRSDPPRSDLIDRLELAMSDRVWQREGLSIRDLANDLAVPEHRLRRAINIELGQRNFSSFINTHRIDAAKLALSDPKKTNVTILEIAYDVGFASLGPFNKAFRAQTGQSPREYRANPG